MFFEEGIGCVRVVRGGKVVGIMRKSDLVGRFVRLRGADEGG